MDQTTLAGETVKLSSAQRRELAARALQKMHRPGDVFEIRALDVGSYKSTFAGFFDDPAKAAEAAIRLDDSQSPRGVYFSLNPVQPELLSRIQNRLDRVKHNETASDQHILRRRHLMVDVDPVRISGIPATDLERAAAHDLARAIAGVLTAEFGWPEPAFVDSGNGAYLLFPVDLPNDADSTQLISRVLSVLSATFSTDVAKIDVAVFNASRIIRLPGTANRKGDHTEHRPHRTCGELTTPESWGTPISPVALKAVADLAAKQDVRNGGSGAAGKKTETGEFNHRLLVERWLADNGVEFKPPHKLPDGRECWPIRCPFNGDHAFDANITQDASGKLGARCFHDSCQGNGWREFKSAIGKPERDHYDPPLTAKSRAKASGGKEFSGDDRWISIRTDEGRTDTAFSRRFLKKYGGDVHWVPEWKCWLVWDGARWMIDIGACAVTRFAEAISDAIWHEIAEHHTDDSIRYGHTMSNPTRWASALKAAAAQRAISTADLNTNLWLLNCPNGTVDLRSGELRPHRKEDLLTTLCPTPFDSSALAPTWEKFLAGAMPSQPVRDYLRRLCGYALAGRAEKAQEILPIFYGGGSNGKSCFIEALCDTLGADFTTPAAHGALTEKQGERHATERASLYGKRFVFSSESGQGAALDEELVKALTGGDRIKARFCFKDEFEFSPTFTIFLATNHRPKVRGDDDGIWRRLNLIPWDQKFWRDWMGEYGPPELKADPAMRDKLKAEPAGILAWIIRGCQEWQRQGLDAPECVRAATSAYRASQDVIRRFVAERCVIGGELRVKYSEFCCELELWCDKNELATPAERKISGWLKGQGYQTIRSNGRWYTGIGLIA